MPTKPGYRVFINISSFKQVSRGGNKHWLIMVDEFSHYTHSFFLKKKSDQIKILPMWIKGIAKKHRIEIKRIRLDNSGENKSLQKECDKQNLGIIFEFTAPGTPQQNSVAERRIPTLMGRARAMLIQAGIEPKYKEEFWCEVISTATKLDNTMVRPERTKPGVDYTDNFAPVAHDVSFRIALARMMVEKLDSLVMDVETAFLYGDIEEEIFMKSPIGMEEIDPGSSPEDCYKLKKGIYGLCQAARQFWKKFVDTIKQESF